MRAGWETEPAAGQALGVPGAHTALTWKSISTGLMLMTVASQPSTPSITISEFVKGWTSGWIVSVT